MYIVLSWFAVVVKAMGGAVVLGPLDEDVAVSFHF